MSQAVELYNKPLSQSIFNGKPPPTMQITGQLEGYVAGEAYSGSLNIVNSVGPCTVYVMPGTVVPPGASFTVDQVNKLIVLTWQPSSPTKVTTVPSGDFESGTGWDYGPGWVWNTGYDHLSGNHSAAFSNFRGVSTSYSTALIPVIAGTVINAQLQVQQGGSSANNVGAACAITFYDTQRNRLNTVLGNYIETGSNGEWHTSNITVIVPHNAQFVGASFQGNRKRQNAPLYVDDYTWDLQYFPGQDGDDDFPIYLKVIDGEGHVATWQGVLSEYTLNLTSQLYQPSAMLEKIGGSARVVQGFLGTGLIGQNNREVIAAQAAVIVGSLQPIAFSTNQGPELVQAQGQVVSGSLDVVVSYGTITQGVPEKVSAYAKVVTGALTVVVSYGTITPSPESIHAVASVVSGSLTKVS